MKLMIRLFTGEAFEHTVMDSTFVVGRSQKCRVVVPHEGVSRQHVQIDVINGDVYVTDLGSTNGVMIDGKKIPPNKKTPLQLFLNLSFGAVESMMMEFETSDASRIVSAGENLASKYKDSQHNSRMETKDINVAEIYKNPATSSPRAPNSQGKKPPKGRAQVSQKDRNEKFSRIFINVLMIGFLLYAGYYIATKTQDPEAAPKAEEIRATNEDYF